MQNIYKKNPVHNIGTGVIVFIKFLQSNLLT